MQTEFYDGKLRDCPCGKEHIFPLKEIYSGKGVIARLSDVLSRYGIKKPFVLADENTYAAAGNTVAEILNGNGTPFSAYIFKGIVEPDENSIQTATQAFDDSCDAVIGVGSGVINDLGKIVASEKNRFYIIVATAPSMDGYASATSSMAVKGLKISLKSKCPDVIIGDTDVLKNAPLKMFKAGLGDMLAKYVSITEWRLSHEINGEYYCENVAETVRRARGKCVKNAAGLLARDEKAVKAVFDGLIASGIAMAYAGISRPAAGTEHYISHIIDMRGLQFKEKTELHGIQCAVATLLCAKLYGKLKGVSISEERGDRETRAFDKAEWESGLREFLGAAAEPVIELEQKENKYDPERSAARRKTIIMKRKILDGIIEQELPSAEKISEILSAAGITQTFKEMGINIDLKKAFAATKDIRDKYVLASLLWDAGFLGEFCAAL